jgi:hydroxymethylglutaryl-CoA synthase
MTKFGVDAASFYVPSLYLEIKDLAEKRGIEPAKLEKGLGLHKMALPDVHEDAATFAAEALLKLIKDYNINPKEISRVYLGTESALDAAKPTATYAVQMVEELLSGEFGERSFKNCDVVDMTFACVGAVDALHNSLDFVRANPLKKAIVIASDYAKYELASSGEYTQGGGAVAFWFLPIRD